MNHILRSTAVLVLALTLGALIGPTSALAQDERSADEIARELSNPTAAVSALTSNIDAGCVRHRLAGAFFHRAGHSAAVGLTDRAQP